MQSDILQAQGLKQLSVVSTRVEILGVPGSQPRPCPCPVRTLSVGPPAPTWEGLHAWLWGVTAARPESLPSGGTALSQGLGKNFTLLSWRVLGGTVQEKCA